MRRLFISLYVAVVAAFICSLLGVPWLITAALRSPVTRYAEHLAVAPQYLFEQELQGIPQEQWPAALREMQSQFGYEVTLTSIEAATADDATRAKLRRGLPSLPPQKASQLKVDTLLLPLRGSDQVVTLRFAESAQEQAERGFSGVYYLLENNLARLDPAQRAAEVARRSAQFGVPLRYLRPDDPALPPALQLQLRAHRVVGVDLNQNTERYYKLLRDDSAVVQIGPMPMLPLMPYARPVAYVSLALICALAIFLWVRPLWRDMQRLDVRTTEFGTGDLSARVEVASSSPVHPLANTFNAMADRVQGLITSQRELMHAVSHELRTPLARLRFAAELMTPATADADRARLIEGMRDDIRELEELVDETLTYARLTSTGVVTLNAEAVDVVALINGLVETTQRLPAPVHIHTEFAQAVPTVQADRRQLARALQNLVRNAVQHAHSQVRVSVSCANDTVCIHVDDDGPGIPPAQREAIFKPFHRLDTSRNRDTGGYGLGLAIARRVMDLHGAQLTVGESSLGGARFEVRF